MTIWTAASGGVAAFVSARAVCGDASAVLLFPASHPGQQSSSINIRVACNVVSWYQQANPEATLQERRAHQCRGLRPLQVGEVHLELKHHYCNALVAESLPPPHLSCHLYIRVPRFISCVVLRNIASTSGITGA